MNQRTHAWIAIRAIRLLEDEGSIPNLVSLLKPFAKKASIGAWIPDKRDAKLGGAATQNHVFKLGPYKGPENLGPRFVVNRDKMLKSLGPERMMPDFIENHSNILDPGWWSKPYRADPPPGKHLANRAMALDINNIDMLILGDTDVQNLVPGNIGFIKTVAANARTTPCQVALFFFMLSHFIADAMMPCHCDERDLSDYSNGLHEELESHWSRKVGSFFDEKSLMETELSENTILNNANEIDERFGITFKNLVPATRSRDIWDEVVLLCRASFSMASAMAPYDKYPYKPEGTSKAPFNDLFTMDQAGKDLLAEVDRIVMHDAVLNVAMVWKDIWMKFN